MKYNKEVISLLYEMKHVLLGVKQNDSVVPADLEERILQLYKNTDDELVRDLAASFLRYIDADFESTGALGELTSKQYLKIYRGQLIDD